MIRRCCYCKKIMGEKEPLNDKRITDGICDDCYESLMDEHFEGNERQIKNTLDMGTEV